MLWDFVSCCSCEVTTSEDGAVSFMLGLKTIHADAGTVLSCWCLHYVSMNVFIIKFQHAGKQWCTKTSRTHVAYCRCHLVHTLHTSLRFTLALRLVTLAILYGRKRGVHVAVMQLAVDCPHPAENLPANCTKLTCKLHVQTSQNKMP